MVTNSLEAYLEDYFDRFENIFTPLNADLNISEFTYSNYIKENEHKKNKLIADDFCKNLLDSVEKQLKIKNCSTIDNFSFELTHLNPIIPKLIFEVCKKENFMVNLNSGKNSEKVKNKLLTVVKEIEVVLINDKLNHSYIDKIVIPTFCEEIQIKSENKFDRSKLNKNLENSFEIKGKKRRLINKDSMKRFQVISQNTRVNSANKKTQMNHNFSLHLTPTKADPKVEICNNLSFDINKSSYNKPESIQNTISNNFNYNFNYGYGFMPSLQNYESNIKNYSPIQVKTTNSNLKEIETIYENIKKDFTEIRPYKIFSTITLLFKSF